jgi:hemolysin III
MDAANLTTRFLPLAHRTMENIPGPRYIETDLGRWIVEPFNAASAGLFLLLAAWWTRRLWPRRRQYPFLLACMPLLVIGGIGGTVYHAFRGHWIWLLMDWVPIALLTFAGGVWLWSRLLRQWWWALPIVPAVFVVQRLGFAHLPRGLAINLSYSLLAAVVVVPAILVLLRTRGRHGGWVATAFVAFVLALSCRMLDARSASLLAMGSHWLWHVFGAVACHCCLEYFFRLRREDVFAAAAAELHPTPAGATGPAS